MKYKIFTCPCCNQAHKKGVFVHLTDEFNIKLCDNCWSIILKYDEMVEYCKSQGLKDLEPFETEVAK